MGTGQRVAEDNPPVNQPLSKGSTRPPPIPPGLGSVIERLTRQKPADRYGSASELVRDLQRLQSTRPNRVRLLAAIATLLTIAALATYVWLRATGQVPTAGEWLQITNVPDSVVDPALSPDGSLLAFLRGERTFTPAGRVYVMNLPSGQPRPVTQDADLKLMGPVISPDGLTLAWTRIDRTGLGIPGRFLCAAAGQNR
jgi:WD40-like Beta Propeller Repeat